MGTWLKSESVQLEADAEPKDSLNSMETWLKSGSVQLEADTEQVQVHPGCSSPAVVLLYRSLTLPKLTVKMKMKQKS
jgi:hypothetical protein